MTYNLYGFSYLLVCMVHIGICEISNRMHFNHSLNQWSDKTVYYDIDPYLFNNKYILNALRKGLAYMHKNTCVRWQQRFPWRDNPKEEIFLSFIASDDEEETPNCSSEIGRNRRGQHFTYFGYWCFRQFVDHNPWGSWQTSHLTAVLHEMMHILGFSHEHVRPDRDCYIRVYIEYLFSSAFHRADPKYWIVDYPYDYQSILHYSDKYAVPLDPSVKTLGRRDGTLSPSDLWQIDSLYCGKPSYKDAYPAEWANITAWQAKNPNCKF